LFVFFPWLADMVHNFELTQSRNNQNNYDTNLMHQMRISTNQVSSVTLRPKIWKSFKKKCLTVKQPGKKRSQIQCHEIEPNPPKDRAMHEGDSRSI
jgi:hypothetical protein